MPDDNNATARARLAQVSQHIAPATPTPAPSSPAEPTSTPSPRRRRKPIPDDPAAAPADWSDVLSQLTTLRTLASTPPQSSRGYTRQKQAGKLWVRERVAALLDPGSFQEVGSASGTVTWRPVTSPDGTWDGVRETPTGFVPSNNVQGFGRLRGRRVLFTADDYSIRAGHADGALGAKTVYMEKLALTLRLPMVKLVDGSSGGGSVTTIATQGFSYIPPLESLEWVVRQLNAGIPNVGAVLGPAIGLGAARVVLCHFSVMAADVGSLFNAGPKVVAGATFEEGLSLADLGGPDMHCRNGTIDNIAADERDAFEQMRTVLEYLPNSGAAIPPCGECRDDAARQAEELRSIIPRKRERMYDPRKIITTVVDEGSWFEIGRLWGTTAIVGLARFGGRPVAIVSNNCEVGAGALDAAGSQKIAKHLKLSDVMNLPLVQFVDIPGYAVGTVAERSATMRHGVNVATAYYTTTMPIFSVITRRVYGVAGGVMLDCRDPRMRVAWPSGDWGSLPLAGGIEVGHSAELKRAGLEGGPEKAKELYDKLEKNYTRLMNPVRTANAFGVEEIIDPAVTRPVVCEWVRHVYDELLPLRLQDRATGKIHPQFA